MELLEYPTQEELVAKLAGAMQAQIDRADRAETEVERLKQREAHFASVLSVADGGQYRNDWNAAIQRVVRERDEARDEITKLREINEVLSEKLDDMIVVRGQALACSGDVRVEVERLREELSGERSEIARLRKEVSSAVHAGIAGATRAYQDRIDKAALMQKVAEIDRDAARAEVERLRIIREAAWTFAWKVMELLGDKKPKGFSELWNALFEVLEPEPQE